MATKMIHHNDCTWCIHRHVFKPNKDKSGEIETCNLSSQRIPAPRTGGRYCERYQQENCVCQSCTLRIDPFTPIIGRNNDKL